MTTIVHYKMGFESWTLKFAQFHQILYYIGTSTKLFYIH